MGFNWKELDRYELEKAEDMKRRPSREKVLLEEKKKMAKKRLNSPFSILTLSSGFTRFSWQRPPASSTAVLPGLPSSPASPRAPASVSSCSSAAIKPAGHPARMKPRKRRIPRKHPLRNTVRTAAVPSELQVPDGFINAQLPTPAFEFSDGLLPCEQAAFICLNHIP